MTTPITRADIVEALLKEVDGDIAEMMLADTSQPRYARGPVYKAWELIDSPELVILQWQHLRREEKRIEITNATATSPTTGTGE